MKSLQIKLNKKSAIVWAVVLFGFIFVFMAVYPSMANDSMQSLADKKLEGLPPALLSIVGFESIPDFTDIKVFYAYIMQYLNIALVIFALSLGLGSFLQEEIDGTIEYLFAQPLSRKNLVIGKLIANIFLVFFVVSIVSLAGVLSFVVFRPDNVGLFDLLTDTIPLFISYYFLAFIFLILGSGLSLLLKSGSKVSTTAMALVFASYFIGIMASLVEILQPLKSVSLLHALFPSNIYLGDIDYYSIGLWIIFSMLIFFLGFVSFKDRDILV